MRKTIQGKDNEKIISEALKMEIQRAFARKSSKEILKGVIEFV